MKKINFSSPSVDIIESSTKIIGDIFSEADFRIDGIVEEMLPLEKLLLENLAKSMEKSKLNADISGSISGRLKLTKSFLISESIIQGDIITGKLSVEEGNSSRSLNIHEIG